jgi:hypothetical protein
MMKVYVISRGLNENTVREEINQSNLIIIKLIKASFYLFIGNNRSSSEKNYFSSSDLHRVQALTKKRVNPGNTK